MSTGTNGKETVVINEMPPMFTEQREIHDAKFLEGFQDLNSNQKAFVTKRLRQDGLTMRRIGELTGMSPSEVHRYLKRYKAESWELYTKKELFEKVARLEKENRHLREGLEEILKT